MMLFDYRERTRLTPMQEGEGDFDFYDSSARPEFVAYRQLINTWLGNFNTKDARELVSRFKSADYKEALAELIVHTALVQLGYSIETHPICNGQSRRPDFLVRSSASTILSFVEVTSFGETPKKIAQRNRTAVLYNAIDKMKLPIGYYLGFHVIVFGASSPSSAKLFKNIEVWIKKTVPIEMGTVIRETFSIDDWEIEIELIKGARSKPLDNAIHMSSEAARFYAPEVEIKKALNAKSTRYGTFNSPYIIVVVDCKNELIGGGEVDKSLLEALFGNKLTVETSNIDGTFTTRIEFARDGFWGHPSKPQNQNVSAVILLPSSNLLGLRSESWQPLIAHNPWASYGLENDFFPISGYRLDEKHRFQFQSDTGLADILGLPDIWPPSIA